MRARRVWILVALLGCEFGSPDGLAIDNSCTDDASCAGGVCDGTICIDDSGASVELAIEVLRGASEAQTAVPSSWAFGPESASGSSTRDLVLPETREVRGTVRWDGARVPATLRFVRRMTGPVASLSPSPVEVSTSRAASGGDEPDSYDFSAILVAGQTYDVTVLPSSDTVTAPAQAAAPAVRSLPPLYLVLFVNGGDRAEPLRFDLAFPTELADPCEESLDVGCTLEATVLGVDGQGEHPEAGLQVRAIDKQTMRVVSSIGETDENGRFAIRIGSSSSAYVIRVTSSAGGPPFASVSVDPVTAFASDPIARRIYIPRLSPVRFTGRVRDTNDVAVPAATVRFLATGIFGSQIGLEGSFSSSATTDEEGRFGTDLLPGLYTISVTPPADVENAWGILSAEALVDDENRSTEALIVPTQVGLRGWVTTFRDESATGVTVLARARSDAESGARSQEAVSSALGAFVMTMDPGVYDIQVKASAKTGFAWLIEPELVMRADWGDVLRGYQLDPPIPVQGILRSSDGAPVPSAMIRAYLFIDTGAGTSRPLQVAETVSGEDGRYRLLIAPHLGGE
ncbi:MAG: carboxypeptidase-like regulatory domain-containing protein [Polyangiales bacterium]